MVRPVGGLRDSVKLIDVRFTAKAINEALANRGSGARLEKGEGYFYPAPFLAPVGLRSGGGPVSGPTGSSEVDSMPSQS